MKVQVENITKTYTKLLSKKTVEAVKNVSFEIKPGEIYALLGPNGAGKSTLIKMIAGLIIPTSGKILFDDKKVKNYEALSAVLEGTRNVYWRLTPLENLHYFANLRGVPTRTIKAKAEQYLVDLDIDAKKKNQSRHLSRGMLQKLAIASALITDPQILLLDEPTLGVDVASARKIKQKIRDLAKKEGKTILLTTHQMDLVDKLADRVGIINKGELIREGTIQELKQIAKKYLYEFVVKGKFTPPALWKKKYDVKVKNSNGDLTEMEIDCKSAEGFKEALETVSKKSEQIISVRQTQDDLEEVFLRSVNGG
ncbi:MAG: ABC transporter ATP-binding protein [Leptospirales bacterium]